MNRLTRLNDLATEVAEFVPPASNARFDSTRFTERIQAIANESSESADTPPVLKGGAGYALRLLRTGVFNCDQSEFSKALDSAFRCSHAEYTACSLLLRQLASAPVKDGEWKTRWRSVTQDLALLKQEIKLIADAQRWTFFVGPVI